MMAAFDDSNIIAELAMKLDPLDARWLSFGLNKPGLKATPEVPQNVAAVLVGPTAASVKWDRAARAGHYRVWKREASVDEQFVAVRSTGDRDITIEALPHNATIEIAVSAVNNGGESARSAVVTLVTQ